MHQQNCTPKLATVQNKRSGSSKPHRTDRNARFQRVEADGQPNPRAACQVLFPAPRVRNFLRAPSDCAAASSSPAAASGTGRVRGRRRAAGLPAAPPRAEAPSCAAQLCRSSLRFLPQPGNLGRLLHLRFGSPEATGSGSALSLAGSTPPLARSTFLRLGDMEPPSSFRRRWRSLLYRDSRAWRRWPGTP